MKSIILFFLLISCCSAFSNERSSDFLCVSNGLKYSPGSYIKHGDVVYYCAYIYIENMKRGVAWVEVEDDMDGTLDGKVVLKK